MIPGAAAAVATLGLAGWAVVVVSNQSGLARGLYSQEALEATMAKLRAELRQAGGRAEAIYYCPHAPGDSCDCRKPAPGMVLRAAQELRLDLARSYMVGDKECDIACGQAVGVRTILVETGLPEERPDPRAVRPDHVAPDLAQAVAWILQQDIRQPT